MSGSDLIDKSTDNLSASRFDLYNLLFKRFPQLYRPIDAVLHLIMFAVIVLSAIALIINNSSYHYTVQAIPPLLLTAAPGLIVVWIVATLIQPRYSRVGLFLSSLSQVFFYIAVCMLAVSALITTPHKVIDSHLLNLDNMVGFSTTKLIAWVHQSPIFVNILRYVYASLDVQVFLAPIALAIFNDRRGMDRFVLATFIGLIVIGSIYYFWPTIAPAGILHSQYFLQNQYDLVQRFVEVHQGQPITVFDGGLVAFPSAHVFEAVLLLFVSYRYKWVFYPLLILNLVVIFSTLGLGYHYLTDVVAGAMLAWAAIKISLRFTSATDKS